MKMLLAVTLCTLCYACVPTQEIQGEMVDATLVKVEEVNRYPNIRQKVLTWQTDRSVSFVTIEPLSTNIPIGAHTKVIVQR